MKTALELIKKERERQIKKENRTSGTDDIYINQELLHASKAYIESSTIFQRNENTATKLSIIGILTWPRSWDVSFFKPEDSISDLVRAGALIAAEIDRLQRIDEHNKNINKGKE